MSDLIDRKAAIRATWQEPSYTDPWNVLTEMRDRINALPTIPAPRWEGVEDGVYAVKDGVVYKMEVKTPEGKTVKLPRIRLTDAMRYEPPKEE